MNHSRRMFVRSPIAALVAVVAAAALGVMTSAPAGADTAAAKAFHVTWHGYDGVGMNSTIGKAGRVLHVRPANHCGAYKSVATPNSELVMSSQFGTQINRVDILSVQGFVDHAHPATGPHGVALGGSFRAAKKAHGGTFHTYTTPDDITWHWVRGPSGEVLYVGLDSQDDVDSFTLTESHKIAVEAMNYEGGC